MIQELGNHFVFIFNIKPALFTSGSSLVGMHQLQSAKIANIFFLSRILSVDPLLPLLFLANR